MRIGFDAKRAFFNNSGLGNYSRWMLNGLKKLYADGDYILFSPKQNSQKLFDSSAYTEINPKSKFYNTLGGAWRSYGMTKDISKCNLDLYHGLSHELPIGIEKVKGRSVVTMHDCIFLRFPELFAGSYRMIFKRKYAYALKYADRVVAISEQTKKDVIRYFGVDEKKIDVVYQGCNPIFYTQTEIKEKAAVQEKYTLPKEYILYVGTIEKRKNLLEVIKAMHLGNIDVPLVAVGRPTKYLDELLNYIKMHKLEKRVAFRHNVETMDLPAMYQMASVFVYPSLFEGFGIPILEALNSGTAVITSEGSCFPEVGGRAAAYVEYGNTEQLMVTLQKVAGDSELKKTMIEEGLTQALKFREQIVIPELMQVYDKTLS